MLNIERYLDKTLDQKELYDELIGIAKNRKVGKSEYYEFHHIVPKCMGGSNDDSNLVPLTVLEHILAHIILTRLYPNVSKLVYAANCMLNFRNKDDIAKVTAVQVNLMTEIRERSIKLCRKPVVCYRYTKVDESDIEIFRIFDCSSYAVEEGFSERGIRSVLSGKQALAGGYNWMKLSDCEELYPQAIIKFRNLTELPEIKINKYRGCRNSIICYDANYDIKKIYIYSDEFIEDFPDRDFFTKHLNDSKRYYKVDENCYLTFFRYWSKKEKIYEYYDREKDKSLRELIPPTNNLHITQVNSDTKEIVTIYPTLVDIQDPKPSTVKKLLQEEDLEKRGYKGNDWYRVSEYLDLHPNKTMDIIEFENTVKENNEKPMEMKILLTIPEKLVSVNDLYKAKIAYKGGRPYPVLYKNPKSVQNGNVILDQLRALDLSSYIPWLKKTKKYEILMNFVFKSGVYRRDTQNYQKDIIDFITSFIKDDLGVEHFDDSEIFECSFSKSICPGAKKEMVCFILRESYVEERIDIIEKPTRIYLAGPENSIKEDIVKGFKDKRDLDCFNPESSIWDKEMIDIERFHKCDTDLYLITPGQLSEELVGEIINRLTTKPSGNFLYIALLGGDYSNEEYMRVEMLKNLVKGGVYSRSYFKYLDNIEDLYSWIL